MLLFLTAMVGCLGCQDPGPETSRSQQVHFPTSAPDRMLGALIEHGEKAWSFKMAGPKRDVANVEPKLPQFLEAIKWADDTPDWNPLPKGWVEDPEKNGRFATIHTNVPGIDISVFELSKGGAATLPNLNRWRGQMGLTKTVPEYLDEDVKDITIGGEKGKLIDITGNFKTAPAMPAGMPPPQPKVAPPKLDDGEKKFDYDLPKGWVKVPAKTAFALEQFSIDGDPKTVMTISLAGGDPAANIDRWRGILKLPKVDAGAIKKLDTRSGPAFVVDLVNPQLPGNNRMLGAIIPVGRESVFLKLMGPDQVVGRQTDRFEAFTKSFKFE